MTKTKKKAAPKNATVKKTTVKQPKSTHKAKIAKSRRIASKSSIDATGRKGHGK